MRATATTRRSSKLNALRMNESLCSTSPKAITYAIKHNSLVVYMISKCTRINTLTCTMTLTYEYCPHQRVPVYPAGTQISGTSDRRGE